MEKTIKLFEEYEKGEHFPYEIYSSDVEHVDVKNLRESVLGGESKKLKKLVSKFYAQVPDRLLIIEGGCSNANFHIFYTLTEKGDEVLVEDPSYEPLVKLPQIFKAKVKRFSRSYQNKFQPDIKEIKDLITNKTKMIVLTNFHNPSGVRLKNTILEDIISLSEENNLYLFFDEIYGEPFIKKDINSISTLTNLGISSYGLSKRYGLSTLRFGLIASNKEIIEKIKKASFTTYVGTSGLLNKEWIKFFESDIHRLHERSEKIINKNFNILEKFVNFKKDVEWVKPEKTSLCILKLRNIKNLSNFINYLAKNYEVKVARVDSNEENLIRVGLGIKSNIFEEAIKRLGNALDSYEG